jgi:hypothetical protein
VEDSGFIFAVELDGVGGLGRIADIDEAAEWFHLDYSNRLAESRARQAIWQWQPATL